MNPRSMSIAERDPAADRRRAASTAASPPASSKSRKPCTSGKPGRSVALPAPPTFTARNSDGKMRSGGEVTAGGGTSGDRAPPSARRARVGADLWRASTPVARPLRSGGAVGSSGALEVRGPSSRGRRRRASAATRSSDSTASPASSSARTIGAMPCAPLSSCDERLPSLRGQQLAEAARAPRAARSDRPRRAELEVRPPDLRLQRRRRALGDHLAVVDDPDAVGELVGLLEVLRRQEDGRALVVQLRAPRPRSRSGWTGSRPGGRLVEEQHARLVDERHAEVEPAAHPAGVGADAAVGGMRSGRRARAARRRGASPRARGMPWSVGLELASARGPVISGSSAASWSATPIARRTSPGAPATS